MSFKASLRKGDVGEVLYFSANPSLVKLDGRVADFTCPQSGDRIELKTDYWCMSRTPNYFFEKLSDEATGKLGGPWRSASEGTERFVYFYVTNLTYVEFRTDQLLERLERIVPTIEPTKIRNDSWTTIGYRVPRGLLSDIATEVKLKVVPVPAGESEKP